MRHYRALSAALRRDDPRALGRLAVVRETEPRRVVDALWSLHDACARALAVLRANVRRARERHEMPSVADVINDVRNACHVVDAARSGADVYPDERSGAPEAVDSLWRTYRAARRMLAARSDNDRADAIRDIGAALDEGGRHA